MGGEEAASDGDENTERGNWASDLQFIVACMGYSIGLGNVWRFPYMMYQWGGGFLVAYWVVLVLVAYPIFLFELVVGQFTSRGPVHIFRAMIPAFEGLGWATLYVQSLNVVLYNSIFAYSIFYTFSAFASPWKRCEDAAALPDSWNSDTCFAVVDYVACTSVDEERRYYAKKGCFHGHEVATKFLRQLEDDCLHWDNASRYGPGAARTDWFCAVKLQFYFNATSPAHIFRIDDTIPLLTDEKGSNTSENSCQYCSNHLFSEFDTCHFKTKAIRTGNASNWLAFADRDNSLPPVDINLDRRRESPSVILPTAQCLAAILHQSGHSRFAYSDDARFLGDPERHLWHFETRLESPEEEEAAEVIPKLASVLTRYCVATFPEEEGAMRDGGLPTPLCLNRVLDPVESFSSEEYFQHFTSLRSDVRELGAAGLSVEMLVSLLFAWALIVLGVYKGPRWTGKIVYLTAGLPFIMIFILILVSAFLPGSSDGVAYYLMFDACRLSKAQLWVDASSQVFYSLGIGAGGLATLASYNRFHTDIVKDSLLISLANCTFSFIGGVGIFGVIGFMAYLVRTQVSMVLRGSSTGIAFIVFAQATTGLSGGEIFAFFFYFMLFIYDEVALTRQHRFLTTSIVAFLAFLAGLPLASNMGGVIGAHLDRALYGVGLPLCLVLTGAMAVLCYGPRRLLADTRLMVGGRRSLGAWVVESPARGLLLFTWALTAPLGIVVLVLLNARILYATWGQAELHHQHIYSLIAGVAPICVLMGLGLCCGLCVRGVPCRELLRPTAAWGPALERHRSSDTPEPL